MIFNETSAYTNTGYKTPTHTIIFYETPAYTNTGYKTQTHHDFLRNTSIHQYWSSNTNTPSFCFYKTLSIKKQCSPSNSNIFFIHQHFQSNTKDTYHLVLNSSPCLTDRDFFFHSVTLSLWPNIMCHVRSDGAEWKRECSPSSEIVTQATTVVLFFSASEFRRC